MSLRQLPRREELAAALVAIALVAAGTTAWLRRDAAPEERGARPPRRPLDAMLSADRERRTGELSNGLHFVVRANEYPEKRAELRLVVNAGSVLEMEDQRGLAHAVEHMVFRGTEHFPGRAIEKYLESIGMRAGEDINATTGPDETIYQFTVPTDRPEVLDSALAMLADMASRATFDPAEARTEGGIVLSEWRSRHDASDRIEELRDSTLLEHSIYGRRYTIGDTAVLRRFDVAAMRRFYDDWYRPELMSIIVVGDVDTRATMLSVKRYFDGIRPSATPRTRPAVSAPRVHALRAAALTDSEVTGVRLSLVLPRAAEHNVHLGDYRAHLVRQLWRAVLEDRLQAAAEEPGSPLLSASVEYEDVVRPVQAEVISASIVDGTASTSLDMMVEELTRLARHGPTARELHQITESILHRRAEAAQWSDQSDDLADAYVAEFLRGNVPIDRKTSYALATELLPTIGILDIMQAARAVSLDSGALVVAVAPRSGALLDLSPRDLISRARAASAHDVDRKHASLAATRLMPEEPAPGVITSERILPEVDAFEWTLANGMRVILKPTNFASEQLEFRLVGVGGASLASDADYPSAFLSDDIVRTTGVGTVNGRQLARLLDGSSIDFNRSVSDDAVRIWGYGAPREVETIFQLLHLHFTAPRADSAAFRRYRERVIAFAAHRQSDPDAVFRDTVAAVVGSHHQRALRSRFYDDVDLSRSLAFWNARMANAANFTLVLTGDFTLDLVR
ncbi:MAG: insulinase family protein, partial [Gemmatimonadetes bacterium]|nr:insulinase family protein [Gemmatimonadota bacterium]